MGGAREGRAGESGAGKGGGRESGRGTDCRRQGRSRKGCGSGGRRKGGDNGASHAHLDLGTFVYDADGVRWANDLGPDEYNLPGYFGANRWDYYRLRTEGHNTLTIDGENQAERAAAPIIAFSANEKFAVADLSKGYPKAKQVHRGVQLIDRRLIVQDEVQSDSPLAITWNLHTPAKIKLNGREAELTQRDKRLHVQIIEPKNARFASEPSDIPPATQSTVPRPSDQNRKPGTKLVIHCDKAANLRLVVAFSPDESPTPQVRPLDDWK